jgi:nicotinate-nucleotide--dimethylbenzimidazole phosphoribosyltransferase
LGTFCGFDRCHKYYLIKSRNKKAIKNLFTNYDEKAIASTDNEQKNKPTKPLS